MSMKDYAVDDYGIVLNTNILNVLAVKLCEDYTDEAWEEDRYGFIESVVDTLGLESICNFSGEAMKLNDDGSDNWSDSEYYSGDSIYYMGIPTYPTLFKAPYKNMDELIGEFKSRFGKYLPENFQYRESICHIVGTYFG